ncbi:hypothetical protein RB614_20790 [Phytohabitans sp. ZYX-F-186]|uniref:Uncharacterized protein n=1 Tax=Phytohabitans maris TaxID=3071409 RepID=A0ABU0ZKN5_9ACTN|nr:hypothetical protein [Phytohabitans sp. ZYX-F-186]MDQ7906954.1 hypothetical protein [Phytohabitans sp. ZYX-F-186]
MPASAPPSERPGRQLLTVVFWVGVGLAPLAALLLLVGQSSGVLRVAAVLAVFAIVLIGVSITLRRDTESMRYDLEETLLEEIDTLRGDVRNDIATAARATHRAFGEKLQALHETVQALRVQMQLDAARGQAAPPPPPARGAAEPPPQVGFARVGYPQQEAPAAAGHASIPMPPQPPASGHAGGRARVPGVVRHTETVQVTTRQTIVDQGDDSDAGGKGYGGGSYGANGYGSSASYGDWPASAPPSPPRGRRAAEPEEESWTDQRLRGGGDARRPRPYERGDTGDGDDGRWTGVRAGDRWAAMRSDDRGREVHMGERRAAMHQDDMGSEMRIEDRWASVRREEPRRDDHRAEPAWGGGYQDTGGQESSWSQDRWERRGSAGALPAGGIEPTTSWGQQWSTPEREPAGRRRRYRDEDDSYR